MRRGMHHYISVWLGAVMMVIAAILAIMLAFTPMWQERMFGAKRNFMIVLLAAYAVYRGFRIYSLLRSRRSEQL